MNRIEPTYRDLADAAALTACESFPAYALEHGLDLRAVQNRAARLRRKGLMGVRKAGRKAKESKCHG